MEKQKRKRRQFNLLAYQCSYTQYTWPPSRFSTTFKKASSKWSWEICDRICVTEKGKWINIGTDKQYVADSFIYSTTFSLPNFVLNFKLLCQVVPDK